MRKFLTFLLVLAMLVPMLASCGGNGDDSSGGTVIGGDGEWYEDLNFKNKQLKVAIGKSPTYNDGCTDFSVKYVLGPDKIGSDDVLNLCYNRNRDVATTLGLRVNYNNSSDSVSITQIESYALAPTSAPDIVISDTNTLLQSTLSGYLINLNTDAEDNYLNLKDDGWYEDYMNSFTLDKNVHYGLAGDFFIGVLQSANVILMNTDYFETMINTYTLDDFYDTVNYRQFTADIFIELIEAAYSTKSGSERATKDDGIGLLTAGGTWLYPYIFSSNDYIFEYDNKGELQITENTGALYALTETLLEIYYNNGTVFNAYPNENGNGENAKPNRERFVDASQNNVLFLSGFRLGDLEDPDFLGMENKMAIVYPLMDEDQEEYKTYVNASANVGMVLRSTSNFTPASAYLELINEESASIIGQYFQNSLKFKYNTEAEGVNMLDVVYDTIGSSFNKAMTDGIRDQGTNATRPVNIISDCITADNNRSTAKFSEVQPAFVEGLRLLKAKFAALEAE